MMRFVVTAGSGFVGSNLIKKLLKKGYDVTVYDSKPKESAFRLKPIIDKIKYQNLDLENLEILKKELKGYDVVVHFAASANTKIGKKKTDLDLKQGTIVTYNILEAMRVNKIKKIIFSSSSNIYGNPIKIPTPEDTGMLFPVSLYGAAKLASEGLISSFCHLFDMQSWIFRFGYVVGPDMTRGAIKDFIQKLNHNSGELEILGNGLQQRDIIFIDDCIDGILFSLENSNDIINVFNLGSGTTITINDIAKMIIKEMDLKNTKIKYTGGKEGWSGDIPVVHFDISKIKKLGWHPKLNAKMAVKLVVKESLEKIRRYEKFQNS